MIILNISTKILGNIAESPYQMMPFELASVHHGNALTIKNPL